MPDRNPEQGEDPLAEPDPDNRQSGEIQKRGRSGPMTPELRRFLGPGRTVHDQPEDLDEGAKSQPDAPRRQEARPLPREQDKIAAEPESPREKKTEFNRATWKPSHALEMQNVALVGGVLLLLALTFYLGKRFEYWKYAITSRKNARIFEAEASRFPGVSASELINQGLVAERMGNWEEAANRFIAAKFKNLSCSGLLFRAGKLYYDHAVFDGADQLFDRAIALGENVDAANYYRGMIASGRDDFPAAEHFFEAASNAAPFNADYLYSWGEALRKHLQPKAAIDRYEQAALRANESEALVCRFKERMALLESGDIQVVQNELEKKQSEGPLSVDWLMTAAALQIHAGDIEDAVRTVEQARGSDQSRFWGAFAACVGDRFFSSASRNHPDLAQACRLAPSPSSSPPVR